MNGESFAQKVNWPQAITEVALIVVGILIALGVNSWWEERLAREAEISYLEALQLDFHSNRESLEAAIENQENVIREGDEVLRMIKIGLTESSSEEFFSRVGNKLYFFPTWTPVTGTYDDLINSGRLLYIENGQLRNELSEFRRSLQRVLLLERLQTETFYQRQSPFLTKHQDINYQNWSDAYQPPESPFSVDVAPFATLEYWNMVVEWIYVHADIVGYYKLRLADCDRILELIESELANK